ncbi:MAG TPA: carboxypeptidase-like regulatory domain-containing protein [Blastocatellia bacterium]|nr:carboxypeptidase-like regulatory domain-containing protein [Blastocatellia bacterium]
MAGKSRRLDSIRIPEPCPVDWEEMQGDELIRYCSHCAKRVFNLSAMSSRNAELILSAARGPLCVRLTRTDDGTTLTIEPPRQEAVAWRRPSPLAVAAVTAILGLGPEIGAQPLRSIPSAALSHSAVPQQQTSSPETGPVASNASASISGTVSDQTEAVIVGAEVTLTNDSTGITMRTNSSDVGDFSFKTLQPGRYTLALYSPGFAPSLRSGLTVEAAQELKVNTTLAIETLIVPEVTIKAEFTITTVSGGSAVSVIETQRLRTLYSESDLVLVARVGKSVLAEKLNAGSLMKTTLDVSAVAKGNVSRSTVRVYHLVLDGDQSSFMRGDNLLVFLKHRFDDRSQPLDGYEVDSERYGVKKLDDDGLSAYLEMINELAALLPAQAGSAPHIIDWIVRCAENPATRPEGLMELEQSLGSFNKSVAPASGDSPNETEKSARAAESAGLESSGADRPDDSDRLANSLSQGQKERLMAALLRIERLTERDLPFIDIVSEWRDPRLVRFLLSQLRSTPATSWDLVEGLIRSTADAVDDDDLSDVAGDLIDSLTDHSEQESDKSVEETERDLTARRSEVVNKFISAVEQFLARSNAGPHHRN